MCILYRMHATCGHFLEELRPCAAQSSAPSGQETSCAVLKFKTYGLDGGCPVCRGVVPGGDA